MKLDDFIHDRGRGPEIKGTRITVYSILDFMIEGWHCERIADFFQLHPEEVRAAMEYVREHTLEVLREYVKMLERSERGNPPELQAKLDANHQDFQELVRQVREAKGRGETDIQGLIQKFRETRMQGIANARNHGG
jgi:uncharacterized protein (DUF433 family)